MEIKYLNREEIEDKKWNGCVHFALNSLPYGYTWYLDNIAESWNGLVLGDYEAVMPLPENKKYFWEYVYTPLFAQQLGVFSLRILTKKLLNSFIDAIPERYVLVDQNVNFMNPIERKDFQKNEKINLEIFLDQPYESLRKKYSSNTLRNLRKAEKNELSISNNIKPEILVSFFKAHIGKSLKFMNEAAYHSLHRVIYNSLHYSMGATYGVFSKEKHLIATAYFIYGKHRMINLLPASNEQGKATGAMALLYDHVISINSERKFILDFEGSMIPSIARYYKGFGAEEVKYWQIKRNNLPWYIKLFKK